MSNFTPQQTAAITREGDLIVVAGAGTGKTHTLISRCLRLIVEERVALEKILLVTFTEAAAAELRGRLRDELLKRTTADPADEHLAAQLALLDTARISTLHGFCLELARENFHRLGLDPRFTVLDEQQILPLQREALDEMLEQHYAGTDTESQTVQHMIRTIGNGADKPIRNLVLKLHAFSQSLPDPHGWLTKQSARFSQTQADEWRNLFVQAASDWRADWLDRLTNNFGDTDVPAVRLALAALREMPANPSIADAAVALASVLAADSTEDNWPRGSVGKVRDNIKEFYDEAEFLGALTASTDPDPLAQDWDWARNDMSALIKLARDFDTRYTDKKRELAGVDFADLEQIALRLLRDSDIASTWHRRLKHIFVDEYQDINAAQDAILTALSDDGAAADRFLVGDVKQSIYRFRLANPKIFQNYQSQWSGRVSLTENFRSREALLNFINPLFGSLMREEAGGVAYEPLEYGSSQERSALSSTDGPAVSLHLIAKAENDVAARTEKPDDPDESAEAGALTAPSADLLATEREARLVARTLRELKAQKHQIWDKRRNAFRAVEWGDMAVLLRSPAGRAEAFAKEFSRTGVPLCAARDGFFTSLEVSNLLNLLNLLDNPLQDVPLAAVLRSPLAGLSADDLAGIRAGNNAQHFWTALVRLRSTDCGLDKVLLAKVRNFLTQFDRWRELIRQTSVSQALETALDETYYEALLSAEPRGAERVANVRKLLDLARQFDPFRRQGLYRFLRFVRTQEEEELDLPPASASVADAVLLISIHKSKGLEFPVVAVACLGTNFNEQDLGGAVLINEHLGLCPKIFPPTRNGAYPSLTHWLARRTERRELRGEELRLLYVAMTRARDALILVGTTSRTASDLFRPNAEPSIISTDRVLKARSHLDWLLAWLPYLTAANERLGEHEGKHPLFHWQILDNASPVFAEELPKEPTAESLVAHGETSPLEVLPQLKARLAWEYPFRPATSEPAKATVTGIRRRISQEAEHEARPLFYPAKVRRSQRRSDSLSATEVGLAHHLFLQLADLEKLGNGAGLREEAARLRDQGILSPQEFAALDLAALADFWRDDLGQRILAERAHVHREIPFTARFNSADFSACGLQLSVAPEEFTIVQGVVDLAVIKPDGLWLVDFKTDNVTSQEVASRAVEYEPQIRLYALALSRIYNSPATDCRLWFLKPGAGREVAV